MSISKGQILQALDSESLGWDDLKAILVEIVSRLPDEDHDNIYDQEKVDKAWQKRPFQEGTDRQGGGGIIVSK